MMVKLDHEGQRHYRQLYTARMVDIDGDSEWLLNTMSVRQAQKALKKSQTQAVPYFVWDVECTDSIPTRKVRVGDVGEACFARQRAVHAFERLSRCL